MLAVPPMLLPELRAKGHLVVVISHDDRYFHVADRVVRRAAGKVEGPVKEAAEAIAA